MNKYTFANTSTIVDYPTDAEHPYTICSNNWNDYNKLDGYERAIMLELMSNSKEFIINKSVIQKRLKFPRQKFLNAWASLVEKHFIMCDKNQKYGVHWVINPGATYNESDIITKAAPGNTRGGTTTGGTATLGYPTIINKTNNNFNNTLDLEAIGEKKDLTNYSLLRADISKSAKADLCISVPDDTSDCIQENNYSLFSNIEKPKAKLNSIDINPYANIEKEEYKTYIENVEIDSLDFNIEVEFKQENNYI